MAWTTEKMIEAIKVHHPHLGETEIVEKLNRAKDDFCAKTELIKDSYTSSTVANQRYYTIDTKIIKILNVWLNDVLIPRLVGKPSIDDDTSETG
jgi:hypothetical protein